MSYGKATPTPSQITDRVWLGSNKHAGEIDASFSACLSVGNRTPRKRLVTVEYLHVPLLDNGPVSASDFSTCVDFVRAHDGEKILISCAAGRNRSAAITTALLVLQGQFPSFEEAYAFVKRQRPCVHCNRVVRESVLAALANGGET
jgi:protein-tyrosine phosphatase